MLRGFHLEAISQSTDDLIVSFPQRLKPRSFCATYGAAEAASLQITFRRRVRSAAWEGVPLGGRSRRWLAVWLLVLLSLPVLSQVNPDQATVTFTLDFPGSMPSHYSIRVDRNGSSHYESSGKTSSEAEQEDEFAYDFTTSEATRQKVFGLAAKVAYFQRDLDSHRKNMAFTGKKMLSYKDAQRSGEATYNYSTDLSVQELTTLFQAISATLEFGHRLEYDRRYQKLALAEELKRMEDSARTTPMVEVQAIAPILQQIVADPGVINISRARAQRLLESPPAKGQ